MRVDVLYAQCVFPVAFFKTTVDYSVLQMSYFLGFFCNSNIMLSKANMHFCNFCGFYDLLEGGFGSSTKCIQCSRVTLHSRTWYGFYPKSPTYSVDNGTISRFTETYYSPTTMATFYLKWHFYVTQVNCNCHIDFLKR